MACFIVCASTILTPERSLGSVGARADWLAEHETRQESKS